MADIINLRQVRKQRARAAEDAQAAANRQRHGRTKGERRAAETEDERRRRDLEGKRLEEMPADDEPDPVA
jgi:hypothetical protein